MIKMEELHSNTWRQLQERRQQLPHALLLTGHAGIGKFLLAKNFVSGLLCENPSLEGLACSACQACHWVSQGNHPDLRVVMPEYLQQMLGQPVVDDSSADGADQGGSKSEKKASQQITIEQIRSLDGFLSVGTHRQGLRVILLYPAEAMNRNTANAILKSLEEPPPSTLFLLVSSDSSSLLPTIRSRCQNVSVPMPESAASLDFVRTNSNASEELARMSLSLCGGAPLQAIKLAEQLEGSWLQNLFAGLAKGGQLDAFALAADLDKAFRESKEPAALRQTVDWVQKWAFDLALACQQQPNTFFTEYQDAFKKLQQNVAIPKVIHFYRHVLLPLRRIAEHPVNARLHLESLFTQYRSIFTKT